VPLVSKIHHLGLVPRGSLGRSRVALCAVFAAHGFIYASWAVRVPAVKQQTGASSAALGLALLCMSAGAVATMFVAGALCRRFGNRPVAVISCALLSVTLILPALAHSAAMLGLALAVFGAAYGGLNVAMNSIAVDLVAALRRPVMPSFHAAWSFGGLAGAGIGGLLAPHLSPVRHLLLVALAGLLVTAIAGRTLLSAATAERHAGADRAGTGPADCDRTGADRADPSSRPARQLAARHGALETVRAVGLFGLIGLCAAYDEGAIGDWGALHLRQDLGASAGLAAAGYAAFALAEATGRLSGTALLERLGRTRVLVLGGLTACAGMLVAALAPDVWLALAGFAATGLGLANLFPAAITRAGLLAGSAGVALASMLGYSGFLLGPPAIGFLANQFGLRVGLTTLSFLALAAAVIAYLSRDTAIIVRPMPAEAFSVTTPDGSIEGSFTGSGPPLLLLHGGPAMTDYMDMLDEETSGWRSIRYQQRGLPPSAVDGSLIVEGHVADAIAVLDSLKVDRAVVLGHSWGGYLALHLARAHPDRVAGLVIVDPLGVVGDGGAAEMGKHLRERLPPTAVEQYAAIEARLEGPDPADADMLASLRLIWPGYFADPAAAPPIPSYIRVSVAGYMATFASVAQHFADGFGEKLRDLRIPAVFVLGERSPMPVSQGEQTAALLPMAEVTVVPAAGHLPWHEQPGCVAAALGRIRELAAIPDAP
jgi:pimeloyl-ACP methyl ester carboxylesterase/predicted MFS family arabinose efflux permease